MKTVTIALIRFYQLLHPIVHQVIFTVFGFSSTCKHKVRCSEYTVLEIRKHGTITGLKKGLARVTQCMSVS
jgi:putative component of membrane protein insertase Oxa1/YidC/SpoIIIJ protein YidD